MLFSLITHQNALMKKLLITVILTAIPLSCLAETLYVGDTLRVGIRPQPNKTLPSIAVIKTGDELELLQRKGGYAKIRTRSGVEGWVTSAYLTPNYPSSRKLKEAQRKIDELEKQTLALQDSVRTQQTKSNNEELTATINALEKEKQALLEQVNTLKEKPMLISTTVGNVGQKITLDLKDSNIKFVYILLGAIVVILSLGFLFGVSWHKKQVTKRLGGLSI